MNKRFLSIICVIAMLAAMLTGCGGNSAQSELNADSSAATSAAVNDDVSIIGAAASEYSIVFADDASDDFKMKIAQFRTKTGKAMGGNFGTVIDKMSDAADISATAKEIVIGESHRPSARKLMNQLRENDYLISCLDGRIYIVGGCEAATLLALEYFEQKYVNTTDKKIEIAGGACDIVKSTDTEYPLNTVSINGVNIRDYNIVISADAELSAKAAAEHLSDWFLTNAGYPMNIVTDNLPETEYEILIGNTNRAESESTFETDVAKLEYVLYRNGSKIVALGDSFMVGGGISALVNRLPLDGREATVDITDIPTEAAVSTFEFKQARNAILMIGDGMGFNQIEMSLPEMNGKFVAADLPNRGQSMTDNVYGSTTDSAAGGTALSTGYKTTNGRIGQDKSGKELLNIRELAHGLGARTAVISNDKLSGATPSAFLSHNESRSNDAELMTQVNQLLKNGDVTFAKGDMGDELCSTVAEGLKVISSDNSRFFMMVEEARIDWECHSNKSDETKQRVCSMNNTAAYVIQFVLCHPDTAMIVTADHETGGLTRQDDGSFAFTSGNHTSANVAIYAIGAGTDCFDGETVENVEIAKFMAKIYGENNFGQ